MMVNNKQYWGTSVPRMTNDYTKHRVINECLMNNNFVVRCEKYYISMPHNSMSTVPNELKLLLHDHSFGRRTSV